MTTATLMASVAQANADTFVVTTNGDDAAAAPCVVDSCTTLRDAVGAANSASGSTITFDPSLAGQTITLSAGGQLAIDTDMTITGPGSNTLAVSGDDASRVFDIPNSGSDVAISGLTITHGLDSTVGPSATGGGGAIFAGTGTTLSLTDDVVSDSSSTSETGGGGIVSFGDLTLLRTTVTGNTATAGEGGGIDAGDYGSVFSSQHAGDFTVQDSTISGNTAAADGGGITSLAKYAFTMTDSVVTGNVSTGAACGCATGHGGGLYISAQAVKYSPQVDIERSTISDNHGASDHPIVGAGILVFGSDTLSSILISRTTISGNGPAGTSDSASYGGGLELAGALAGHFDLLDSTISGNSATIGGGVGLGYDDGPPLESFGPPPTGTIDFDNSTIAANTATATNGGGGIYLGDYYDQTSEAYLSGTATLTSTIVANNLANGAGNDLARDSSSTSGGFDSAFSLIQQVGTAPLLTQSGDLIGIDPQLGALANNGGPTQTQMPAGTSPVIDQGHSAPSLTVDQIGNPRDVDTAIANQPGADGTDIGAVEVPVANVVVPPAPPANNPTTPAAPNAGFAVFIGGNPFGGLNDPLLAGSASPIECDVSLGTLASCTIEARLASDFSSRAQSKSASRAAPLPALSLTKGTLLSSGEVVADELTGQLRMRANLSPQAKSLLRRQPLGVDATTVAVGSAIGSPQITGTVHLLHGLLLTLPIGTRSETLPRTLDTQLDQLAKLIIAAKTVTCTAYTDPGHNDVAITQAQAKAACDRLVTDGIKGKVTSTGKGHIKPLVRNHTEAGRVQNRRLVVTFSF